MRKLISAILLIALVTGCSHLPATPELKRTAEVQTSQAESLVVVQDFAKRLLEFKTKIKVKVLGTSVEVRHDSGMSPLVYNFADSKKTGKVKIKFEDYEGTVSLSKLTSNRAIPIILIHIGIELALGAAKGAAIYYLTHRENFVQNDLYKAMVEGIIFALIPYTNIFPFAYAKELLVLVAAIVKNSKSLHLSDLADSALRMVDQLVQFISQFHVFQPGT
ncbi:MAG TPA: lipoprotein [Chroococcales cyanobacterium]